MEDLESVRLPSEFSFKCRRTLKKLKLRLPMEFRTDFILRNKLLRQKIGMDMPRLATNADQAWAIGSIQLEPVRTGLPITRILFNSG